MRISQSFYVKEEIKYCHPLPREFPALSFRCGTLGEHFLNQTREREREFCPRNSRDYGGNVTAGGKALSMTSNLPCRVEVPVGLGTQELLKHAA
jgi:hypothetical protein